MTTYTEERNAEADAVLRRLSDAQLLAGLEKGKRLLAILDVEDMAHDQHITDHIGHPSQHPGKMYDALMQDDNDQRRRMIKCAISDTLKEIERRSVLSNDTKGK